MNGICIQVEDGDYTSNANMISSFFYIAADPVLWLKQQRK